MAVYENDFECDSCHEEVVEESRVRYLLNNSLILEAWTLKTRKGTTIIYWDKPSFTDSACEVYLKIKNGVARLVVAECCEIPPKTDSDSQNDN